MNIYWLAMVVITAVLGMLYDKAHQAEVSSQAVEVSLIAHNVLVYRNALAEYAYAHKAASGSVADNQLNLPTWYARYPGVEGVIDAGRSYAFFGSPLPGLVSEMINLTGGSLAIGTASSGSLLTPSSSYVGVALPAAVPNGATVAYQ
ncbi:putative Type IV pilus protein PilM [Pseudomonas amygdali pv. myricae]|uniref:type IV pilus biogenesis protein PilM n=1 Tax=Pseudomonas amygdali TaxID=47877 RepID=UPI0006B9B22C|nr:type IV pilus biogenesis protein PilM [Pseudomonas amygdali]KPY00731.1 putative Type IV pilus protein PilM [Pseudomonas amygdali pv. myricae]KWS47143.1 pilus assembly protein PilP [Pseudomonas amygdali pv. myricae]RMT49614.1 putative Type IV pilus protein PilM [Pseudomonas amygdali pv. myricae]RMV05001.1 putative Type IV pilus protein PilM [Pseudomonas amygdali pv. myricae]RMV22243.1 putative Type IV pilus protein PilM [Pseudomonas amygdali pv. myricae]